MIFVFGQNNSGGYYIENEKVAENVVIQANTKEEAIKILAEITADYSEYCSCCGERWSAFTDEEFETIEQYNAWKNGTDYDWRSAVSDKDIRFYESNQNPPYKLIGNDGVKQ